MAERLLGMADSDKIPSYVALQAINSALDRAGVVEQKQLEVTVKPYENLMAEIESGSREDYRRQIGDERAGELPAFSELESAATQGPGGSPERVRVLGTTPDGHEVIDAELVEQTASDDQGDTDDALRQNAANRAHQRATETLANYAPTYPLPNGGYMPTEQAMEAAADANREYRRQLSRP
ncbi:hypothetical protein ACJH6H_14810 [Mycobacterium sp. SMC-21]|uniref:hypothetical protein n=1 Tax=Mycobacterium sp. SMC-21 TaxID=3381632 RepID=UPI003875D437